MTPARPLVDRVSEAMAQLNAAPTMLLASGGDQAVYVRMTLEQQLAMVAFLAELRDALPARPIALIHDEYRDLLDRACALALSEDPVIESPILAAGAICLGQEGEPDERIQQLRQAGALIAYAIDRLGRLRGVFADRIERR